MRRPTVGNDARKFRELMFAQAGLRDLPVAYVVDAKGAVKVAALEDERIPYIAPPEHLIRAAEDGQVPLLMPVRHLPRGGDRQAAQLSGLLSLRGPRRRPEGRHAPARTEAGVAEYEQLRAASRRPQVRARPDVLHDLADRAAGRRSGSGCGSPACFVAPIRRLISAAQQVAKGNLKVRAADPPRRGRPAPPVDELQHHDARSWSASAPTSSPPTASSPSGAASWRRCCRASRPACIGLDRDGRITLASRSAEKLLGRDERRAGRPPARRGRAGVRRPARRERRPRRRGPAAAPGHAHHRRRGAQLLRARHARGRRARRTTARC